MISHFNLGTNDLEKAEQFYNELLGLLNATQAMKSDRSIFYTFGENSAKLAINKPFDGEPATHGNGSMVALVATSPEQADAVHAKALALGGTCEGAPGDRGNDKFSVYGAYFRDLDGNKFGIFCMPG